MPQLEPEIRNAQADPAKETPYKVVVSVSYGDTTKPRYKHTRHLITYSDVPLTEKAAQVLADSIVVGLQGYRLEDGREVMGIYKEERS